LLTDSRFCILLSQSIDRAISMQSYELIAFVFMPEHVHLLVFPISRDASISNLLYAIKRPFSFRVKRMLAEDDSPLLREITIRERPGKTTFRFWQEGSGYDRNILKARTLQAAIEYIHDNPVRRGLCESPDGWKWSSWSAYQESGYRPDSDLPTVHGPPA